jgi:prepilin-type processing-associated H-X9-DG protein
MKSGKLDVHYLAAPGLQMPVAPAWAIHEGRLYVAAFPQVVIAAATGTGEKPLAEDPAFLALRKPLAATPSALVYMNTPALVRRLYGAPLVGWTVLSNMLEREIGPALRPEMLPPLSRVEKYLSTDIFAISSDAKGITFEAYGSGVGATILGGSPPVRILAASFLMPAVVQTRQKAKGAVSMSNLRGIGMACMMYAVDHNGRFPPDLIKLVEGGMATSRMFYSPTSGRKPVLDEKGKPIGPLDYVYLGADVVLDKIAEPQRVILAYERPEINGNRGTNVLYVDGHVAWVSMAQLQAELALSEKALAQARSPAEPKK